MTKKEFVELFAKVGEYQNINPEEAVENFLKLMETKNLVEELKRREGAVGYSLDNYENICEILDDSEGGRIIEAQYTGPGTIIMAITD